MDEKELGILGVGEDEVTMLIICQSLLVLGMVGFMFAAITGVLALGAVATGLVALGILGLVETYQHYRAGAITDLLRQIKAGTWTP